MIVVVKIMIDYDTSVEWELAIDGAELKASLQVDIVHLK